MINNKKKIVFVESFFNVPTFKIACALKKTGKYETILILLSKDDKKNLKKAFDKIFIFDLKFNLTPIGLINFFRKIKSQEGKKFLKKMKKIDPYVFQITGPELVTLWFMYFLKKKVKIYYAYDIWKFYDKKFSLKKNSGIMQFFHKFTERVHFKIADGILHKGPPGELNFLPYTINVPDLSFIPYCLDEWIFLPTKKKRGKEIHLVYAGGSWISWEGHISFLKIIEVITSQKIHFHIFSPYTVGIDVYKKIEKSNKYFHFHKGKSPDKLNKKISKYDFGIVPDFYDCSKINELWPKTTLGNKIFNYIEAGLPVIINDELEFVSKIIKGNKIGFGVNYENLKNLKKIIMKQNYKQLQKNVKKTQEKFKLSKNIEKLERFYEKVANIKG